jgi:hypothetical protein
MEYLPHVRLPEKNSKASKIKLVKLVNGVPVPCQIALVKLSDCPSYCPSKLVKLVNGVPAPCQIALS